MRLLVALVLAIAALLTPTFPAPTAQAAATGDIVGTVLDDLGDPTQVIVEAVAVGDPEEKTVVSNYSSGGFRLPGLAPGDYRGRLHAQGVETRWFPDQVTVVANEDVSVGTITVPRPGSLSGQIWDHTRGGLWPVTVAIHRVRDGVTDTDPTTTVSTGYGNAYDREDDGSFSSGPLVPGDYRLHLTDTRGNHAPQWYGGYPTPGQSPVFTVTPGESNWLKVRYMESGGTVTVPILDAEGNLANYPVLLPWTRVDGAWVQRGWVDVVGAGTYRIQGFGGSTFRLQVLADRGENRLETWYGGGSTLAEAADISSPFGEDVSIPGLRTRAGGIVTGTVRTTAGAAAESVPVSAWRRNAEGSWRQADATSSDATGAFALKALLTGDYQVRVGGRDGWAEHRVDSVHAVEGATTALGDLTAYRPSGLSGKVLDADGNRLATAEIEAWQQADGTWRRVETAWSDGSGNYAFPQLEPGQVKLHLRTSQLAGFAGQWAGTDALDLASSEALTLAPEERRPNVNHVLGPRPSLTGTVTVDGPLAGAEVGVFHQTPDGLVLVATLTTDVEGHYTTALPEVGRYAVHVTAPGHTAAWYGGSDADSATRISARSGAPVVADVHLSRMPQVVGRVLDADQQEANQRVDVELWRLASGEWSLAASTAAVTGNFALPQVEPGTYALRVADPSGSYLPRWYPGVADRADATLLDLGYGDTRDLTVALGARGTLTTSVPFTIGGRTELGDTMTVTSAPEWNVQPDTVTVSWLRDGEDTLDSYQHTIASNDIGTSMSVRVVARKAGYTSAVLESAKVFVPGLVPTDGWRVAGQPVVGKTLRLRAGDWAATPLLVRYTWLRDGARFKGAEGTSYTLRRADAGHRIALRVTARRAGYPQTKFLVGKPVRVRRTAG